ncbi:hypothetical protein PR048_011812 [Dryococelus australis]|uniref:HAT C-terminal dimerisation domain-containing protein n=1 Tax=Dryococelus australis TaxID=614101 RepID=A0ABQ9HML5_9NEOP|nr:hypothetical protein PR048_011812 [Dryococelus australis]
MEQFDTSFQEFKKNTSSFNLYSCPFSISIDDVPEDLQMECVDLQCASDLKDKFNNFSLLDFYKKYVLQETYPRIHKLAILMTLFGSTYLYDQVFSRIKHVNCTSRSRITAGHLESSLHFATSSIIPDIGKLIGGKQCQVSH